MKIRIFLSIIALSIVEFISAQVVTLDPYYATQNDTVTITFDASQGNGDLTGYAPVYAHAGVITNLSSSPVDWRHVQGNWGTQDPKVLMTSIGNNKHQLKYHINSFYNVPSNETVLRLAFVFRNGNGSVVGRNENGTDIFVPLHQGGYAAEIAYPFSHRVINTPGDSLILNGVASDSSEMEFFVDGVSVASDSGTLDLEYVFRVNDFSLGNHVITLEATNGSQTMYDTLAVLCRGGTPIASLPSYGEEGLFPLNDSTMYFQLRAPYKDYVYLVGDMARWDVPLEEFELSKTPDGKFYWGEFSGFDKTKEYRFQYWIGDGDNYLKAPDPYVEKVLDPWNDYYIADSIYPNLIDYPYGKTVDMVGVFQIEEPAYNWSQNPYDKPESEELVIYELLIRDFASGHNYNAVIKKLDYLEWLGVNAIELMPVMEFEGNESWGYNPSFYMAPDKYYGPKNELKRLVDSCHSRGIAVILDIALNHSFGQNPMVQMYFDWNAGQWGQPTAQSPWFNQVPKHDFNVGYDFNHESDATKYFSKKVLAHWINEYKIDGYRMDLSKGFTQKNTLGNIAAMAQYDQGRINILTDYANHMWQQDSTVFVILEHFADNSEETVLSNNNMMLWGNNNHEYGEAAMGYTSNLIGVSHNSRGWNDMNLVSFMESHDEERLMYKNLNFGNSQIDYSTKDIDTALQRVALASAFFYTVPGPKMLWQFGELGYDYSINYCISDGTVNPDCRTYPKPIKWDYYLDANRRQLFNIVGELNYLRKKYPVFTNDKQHELSVSGFGKRIKLQDSNMKVVIIGNFGMDQMNIDPKFHQTGWWYNHFDQDSINVSNVNDAILLKPGEFKLFTTVKTQKSAISIDEFISEKQGLLIEAYPNPFDSEITFKSNFSFTDQVILRIYNAQGSEVYSKTFSEEMPLKFENTDLPSGMYLYNIESDNKIFSGKILKK